MKKNASSTFRRPRLHRFALEARQLFDGAAIAETAQHNDAGSEAPHDNARDAFHPVTVERAAASQPTPAKEVFVIDSQITHWQSLVAQLPQDSKVVVLREGSSGLGQLNQALADEKQIAAIHIYSHGASDEITLGSDIITAQNVAGLQSQLQSLGDKMTAEGDILLYGCSVTSKDTALVSQLATFTHADVAASRDSTGSREGGGNWILETAVGEVETRTLALHYAGQLETPTLTHSAGDLIVSEPSVLTAGKEVGQFSGWAIDLSDPSATVILNLYLQDGSKGTLSDGVQPPDNVFLSFSGTAVQAQAWLNQLTFTASDRELGNHTDATGVDIYVFSDSGGVSWMTQRIIITPANDPATVNDSSLLVSERNGSGTVIGPATLAIVDSELSVGAQTAAQMVYSLTALPRYGYLTLNGQRIGVGSVFTQQDVNSGAVKYVHTATGTDQNTADSFSASLNDGATPVSQSDSVTVTLNIQPENQPPSVSGSGFVFEGQPQNADISGNVGKYIEATTGGDPQDTRLTLTITALPAHGRLYFKGQPIQAGFSFDYADKDKLTYSNDGTEGVREDSFGVRVSDQGGGTGTPASSDGTITLTVDSVNDNPVFDSNSSTWTAVNAGGSVVLTPAMLNATDVDSSDDRISFVVNADNLTHGYLTLNGLRLKSGDTFSVDDIKAGRVSYVQYRDAAPNEQDSFDFQVINHGLNVYWTDAGVTNIRQGGIYQGNAPEFALTQYRFIFALTDKTNNPQPGNVPTLDQPATAVISPVFGTNVNDPNALTHGSFSEGGTLVLAGTGNITDATPGLSYTLPNVLPSEVVYTWIGDSSGSAALSLQKFDNGAWVTLLPLESFTQADVNNGLIRFAHDGGENFTFTPGFTVSAGRVTLNANGDPVPVIQRVDVAVFITPVNDLPQIGGSSNNVLAEGATLVITRDMLTASDPDDANSGTPYENSSTLNGNTNYALNNEATGNNALKLLFTSLPTGGTLQYFNGSSWVDITPANLNTLQLDAAILTNDGTSGLRFVSDGSEIRNTTFSVAAVDRWGAQSLSAATVGLVITNINDGPQIATSPTAADPVVGRESPNMIGGTPANNPLTVRESGYGQITRAMLQAYDPDSSAEQVQFTITQSPGFGRLARSTDGVNFNVLGTGSTFTQQDIAQGYIYYLNDGSDRTITQDGFTFRLSDGDKEQAGNQFVINIDPANDAPQVNGPGSVITVGAGATPVPGFSVRDADLDIGATNVTDQLQTTVRLLHANGTALTQAEYRDVTLGITRVPGLTVVGGNGDLLVLTGTVAQINSALAGLTVAFSQDHNAAYQIQVITDDRLRDASGNLTGSANGGPLNEVTNPAFGSQPGAVDGKNYNWYADSVPVNDGNIAASSATILASSINDPGTLAGDGQKTVREDQASWIGGNFVVNDVESNAFGRPVTVTLTVAQGSLGIGGAGVQTSLNGVTLSGDDTGTLVLTGQASAIQALLNDPLLGLTYLSALNANHDQNGSAAGDVTLTVSLNTQNSTIGNTQGTAPADLSIALTIDAVNDAPVVNAGSTIINLDNSVAGGFTPVPGFSVDDPDITDGGGIAWGESDHLRVTVRLTQQDGTPLAIGEYRGNTSISITSGETNSGVTLITTGAPPTDGDRAPMVIEGTRAQINAWLAQLQVKMVGLDADDADKYYRVEVIADDRNRDATGHLTGRANGGQNSNASNTGTEDAPLTEIDPYAALPGGLAQNVSAASTEVFQSSVNDAAEIRLGDSPVLQTDEGNSTVVLPPIMVTDADAGSSTLTVNVQVPAGFVISGIGGSGGTVDGTGGATVRLTGTLAEINSRLAAITVTLPDVAGTATAADWNGRFGVVVTVDDNGSTGSRPATLPANMTNATSDPGRADYADPTSAAIITTREFTFTVNAVNDAPVATGTSVTLPAIAEDTLAANINGTTVGSLFGPLFDDSRDDVVNGTHSDAFWGIAISSLALDPRQGEWQYSTDGGQSWTAVGPRSDSNALFLNGTAQLRFVPAANFFGEPALLGARLVENDTNGDKTSTATAPVNGGSGSTQTHGGTSLFSDQVVRLKQPVTNVNDSPTLTSGSWTFAEDGNVPATLGQLLDSRYSDQRDNQTGIPGGGNASQGMALVGIFGDTTDATKGHWEYFYNNTWNSLPTDLSASSALILSRDTRMRFVQLADYNGPVTGGLQIRAADSSDTTLVGGAGVNSRVNFYDYAATWSAAIEHWSSPAQLGVNITPVADIVGDRLSIHAGLSLPLTAAQLLANDTFENSGRVIESVTQPANGTLIFDSVSGMYTYTPTKGYVGADSFTYTVRSGGVTETATVNIDVTNIVPVAVNDRQILSEDSLPANGNLLSNDRDGDNDPLTLTGFTVNGVNYAPGATIVLAANQGTLQVNADGTYTYIPVADWNGSVTVGYTISDGNMRGTATGTLTLTVNPVKDAQDDAYIAHAGTSATHDVLLNDSFSNADKKITGVTQPAHGRVTITADNNVLYVPQQGFVGNDSYTYTVTSGGVTETATVRVIMTNQSPFTGNFFATTQEDVNATGNILTTLRDPDGDPLTVTGFTVNNASFTAGQRGTIAGVGTFIIDAQGNYTFTPVADWNGSVPTIEVTVSDGNQGGTNTASLDITVTPVADIIDDTAKTHAGTAVTIDALANDSFENSTKTITGTSAPQHGAVTIVGNKLVYTPVAGYVGSDSFTYTVTSGGVTETATVVVSMTNTAPVSRDVTVSTAEDTPLRGSVQTSATDVDNDPLVLTGFTLNGTAYSAGQTATVEAGSLTMNRDGSWVFTPAADWNGSVPRATYTLSDGNTGTSTSQLLITVIPVADVQNDTATTHADDSVIIPLLDNDTFSDKQRVTIVAGHPVAGSTLSTSDRGGQIQLLADNTLRYLPPANFVGTDTFTYTVTSYTGVTETATVTILVTNSRPGTTDDRQTVMEDNVLRGKFNAKDTDNDVLRVVSFSAGGQTLVMGSDAAKTLTLAGVGTLVVNADMTWAFTPEADWNGTVPEINYTVTDGNQNGKIGGTLTIVVAPVSDARNDNVSLHAGQSDTRNLLANDTFSNSNRQVTSVTQGQHGTVIINADGTVTYTPVASYVGQDTYTYTVTSGGRTETATVYVDITNTPPVPPAGLIVSGPEDSNLTGSVLSNVTDADPTDVLSVESWNLPGETRPHSVGVPYAIPGIGTFTLQTDGQFTFVPVADWNGSVPTITFTATDGHQNGRFTGQLQLVVTPVVDAVNDATSLHSGGSVTIDALNNDSFANSDKTIIALGKPLHGQATILNGKVTYQPDAGYVGADSFTYTVLSGGKEETATITLDVRNTPPQTQPDLVPSLEDATATGNVLTNDQDLDGDALRVQSVSVLGTVYQPGDIITLAGIGTLTLNRDGRYSFVPLADWNGSVPDVTYTVTDGNSNGQASNILRITVRPVQDAFDDRASTHAGVSVLTDVLANDTFSNPLRAVESFTQGAHGTVTLENGQLRYTPVAGYVGTDTYTYSVFSNGVRETATVTVTMLNTLPTSADFALTTAEDTPLSGNVMDRVSDGDNDPLTLTQFTVDNRTYSAGQTAVMAAGTLVMNSDGRWTFTPAADWHGPVPQIGFTVSDGNDGGTTHSLLNIGVVPVGDTHNDFAIVHSDNAVIIPVLANDTFTTPDNQLTLTAGIPVAGSLDGHTDQGGRVRVLSDNTLQYLPPQGYTGIDSFSYTVTTPDGHQEVATVTIAVMNGTPTAQQTSLITPEDTPQLVGQFNAVDPEGDVLTLVSVTIDNVTTTLSGANDRLVDIPGVGTLHVFANRDFTFTPVADWNGVVPQISYTVTDGNNNGTTDGTLFIVVTPEIDAVADSYTMHAGDSALHSPLDNDSFSNPDKMITGVTQGQHGRVEISLDGQHITYIPDPAFVGQDVYSYTVTSGGRIEVAYVTVEVTNTRPVLTPLDPVSGPEDRVLAGNVIDNVTDADPSDRLTVVSWNLPGETRPHLPGVGYAIPGQGTFTLNADGSYTFEPLADWNGSVPTLTFVVSDGHDGGQVTGELNLTVTPVADIQPDYERVLAGQPLIIDALANDSFSNGDRQIVATGNALHGQVTIQNGKITYLPNPGYVGIDTFTYTVMSGGVRETATITVEVTNAAPQPRPDRDVVAEDTPASGNVLANDQDNNGDALRVVDFRVGTLAGVFLPGATAVIAGVGEITLQANGDYLFRPVADWNGDVPQIIYTVSDGNQNGLASQTLDLSVSPVADAQQDVAYIHSSFPGTLDVLANDTFSNPNATLVGVTTPMEGSVSIVNGKVVYTPRPGFVGFDSFEYTVRSGGVEETAAVVVWVTNQAPVARDVSVQMDEDGGTVQGSLPVTDADNDTLRVTGFTLDGDATQYDVPANGSRTILIAGKGTLTITSDRQFTFKPLADWNGTVPVISWQVTDGNDNGATSGRLAIVVNPVADGVDDRGALLKGGELISDVLANDTFEDPTRQVTGVSQGAHGAVTLLPDGRIRYVPEPGYVGADSYTYTVTSGGVTETITVQVVVKPVLELTVHEQGLRDSGGSQTASGSLQVTAFDAAQTITINGKSFTLAELQQFTLQRPGSVEFGFGHLELTGYQATDATHGVLSYRYVQTQAVAHQESQPVQVTFSFTVNGEIGGLLRVNIVDDAPQAQPDTADIYQDRAQYSQSGNLFANDTVGADGPALRGPVVDVMSQNTGAAGHINGVTTGQYGVLRLDANGNWQYEVNRSDPRVAALDANASLQEVFVYTLEDADGNTRQSTLTVIIHGVTAMPQVADRDGWHELLFGLRDEPEQPRLSFTPGLFILPMIYGFESSEHRHAVQANVKMAMLGYGVEQANAPVLEQAVLFPRWFTSTREQRDIRESGANGIGQNMLRDAFSPFSIRHTDERETLHAPAEPPAPVPVVNAPTLESAQGALSLTAQLAALHRQAPETTIVLPAVSAKQVK
ncbi:Ig-like domain-containing protein [Silvania hatchlandensis]|uniref:Ig-like domain-containing protein n=1 Tax=Silvania hatchlandensis TaxID=2926469 RepID=A0A9J6Q590_9ENTR|nr:Ig-like domain-containing protein [Silvania hatchlandensis]MCU6665868.1 Ig-like domain-containing protein [Silvania hatchlandensis]